MDHRRLVIAPLAVGLTHGWMAGTIRVDHRAGDHKLMLDLALRGARLEDLFTPSGQAGGPLRARIRLRGTGRDVRASLRSSPQCESS